MNVHSDGARIRGDGESMSRVLHTVLGPGNPRVEDRGGQGGADQCQRLPSFEV